MNAEQSVRQESEQRRDSFAAFLLNRDSILREQDLEPRPPKPAETCISEIVEHE